MYGQGGTSMYGQTTLMSTPCSMQSQLSQHTMSATDGNLAKHFPDRTPGKYIFFTLVFCVVDLFFTFERVHYSRDFNTPTKIEQLTGPQDQSQNERMWRLICFHTSDIDLFL